MVIQDELFKAVITAVITLVVLEYYEATPWLARKLMRWSVRLRYTDPERISVRQEELAALLEDVPKIGKLLTALGFFLTALTYRLTHPRHHRTRKQDQPLRRSLAIRTGTALVRAGSAMLTIVILFGLEVGAVMFFTEPPSSIDEALLGGLLLALPPGLATAIEVLIWPKLPTGLIGSAISGITLFTLICINSSTPFLATLVAGIGITAGVGGATALTATFTARHRSNGSIFSGGLSSIFLVILTVFMSTDPSTDRPLDSMIIALLLGLMAGCIAGPTIVFASPNDRQHRPVSLRKYAQKSAVPIPDVDGGGDKEPHQDRVFH